MSRTLTTFAPGDIVEIKDLKCKGMIWEVRISLSLTVYVVKHFDMKGTQWFSKFLKDELKLVEQK